LSFSTVGSFLICLAGVGDAGGGTCCTICTFRFVEEELLEDFDDMFFIYLKNILRKIMV
jgi:hypothetical protein